MAEKFARINISLQSQPEAEIMNGPLRRILKDKDYSFRFHGLLYFLSSLRRKV